MKELGKATLAVLAGAGLLVGLVGCSAPTSPNERDDPKDKPSEQPGQALLTPSSGASHQAPLAVHFLDSAQSLS